MALGGVGMILGVERASAEPLSLDDFLSRVVERHGEVAASAARLRAARAAAAVLLTPPLQRITNDSLAIALTLPTRNL